MKIALIRKDFIDAQGGAERYAVSLARGLAGLGHKVHVFAGKFDRQQHPDITIHKVPFIKSPSALKNLSFQRNVRRLLQNHDFDIVQGLSQVFPQDVYRMGDGLHLHWLQIQTPVPWKRVFKLLSPRHRVILAIEKHIFKQDNYRHIIANSIMCKNQLLSYYNVPEEKISLIYNGVDLKRFNNEMKDVSRTRVRKKMGIKKEDIVLLFVGHNFKRKGLQFTIKTAMALKEKGYKIKLVAAGRGNPAPFLKIAEKERFSDSIIFSGNIKTVEELYHASDMLIHPALYDPFSNVCLEAMACGLPVVTTVFNGASEIIENEKSGIVVESALEVGKMVSGISFLLKNNQSGLQAMSRESAQCARNFSVEKNIEKTVKVYEEILRGKGVS